MPKLECTSVVKIECSATEEAEETLDGQSRICNWLYNQLLDKANQLKQVYKETQDPELAKIIYTERGLRNLIPRHKQEHPFLKVVHSSPLKNAALRTSGAIQAYQKSRKGKRKGTSGWPRFRSWRRNWFSLLYDEPNKGFRIDGNTLYLSLGMGAERTKRRVTLTLASTTALENKEIRNLRIVKQLGQFFAVFTVKTFVPDQKPIHSAIALDPNHKNLGYGVSTDNQAIEIEAPTWIKKADKRIDELTKKRDRCKRRSKKIVLRPQTEESNELFYWQPSRRWLHINKQIERVRQKRRDQTKTFLYTVAHRLFRTYDLVSIGDYTPDGSGVTTAMRRAMNNQSLIGRFKETLSWVALKSGKHFHVFNEKGTTRTCCHCGFVVNNGLCPSIRSWECEGCRTVHLRDENSSQNGLRRTLRDLSIEKLVPGSGPVLIEKRWAWCALPSGVHRTSRGQCCEFLQHQEIKLGA